MFVGDSEHNLVEVLRTCPHPSSELLTVWLKVYDPTVSFLQPGVARNIAFNASPTAMDSACLIFYHLISVNLVIFESSSVMK